MKKAFLFAFAVCLLAACTGKETASVDALSSAPRFYASIENSTKTFLDGLKVCWNADDAIGVFNKDTFQSFYEFDGEEGDTSGSFKAESTGSEGNSLPYVYAVFPYSTYNYVEEGAIMAYLWEEQYLAEGSFDPYANVMVAASNDENLSFKNATGILKVRLYGDPSVPVNKVQLNGNNGEIISGDAAITITPDSEPIIEPSDSGFEYCYIENYNEATDALDPFYLGESESKPLDLYFLLYPTTFEKGITISVYARDGKKFTIIYYSSRIRVASSALRHTKSLSPRLLRRARHP